MHFHTGSYDYFCLAERDRSRVFDHQRPAVRLSGFELGIRDRQFGDTFLYQRNGSILKPGQLLQGSQRIGPHNGKNSFYA